MNYKLLVCVLWRDAADSHTPWLDSDEVRKFGDNDCVVSSVGFLLHRGKHYIVLAGDNNEAVWGRVTKIPIPNITAIVRLAKTTKKKGR